MEYEDELDRMRNRKRRPAVRQTEIKKQTRLQTVRRAGKTSGHAETPGNASGI